MATKKKASRRSSGRKTASKPESDAADAAWLPVDETEEFTPTPLHSEAAWEPAAAPMPPPPPPPPPARSVAPARPVQPSVAMADANPEEEWVRHATVRRGISGLAILGWILVMAGLALYGFVYYWSYWYEEEPNVNLAYVAAALVFVGVLLALLFSFLPARRSVGLGPNSQPSDFFAATEAAHRRVRMGQTFVAIGLALLLGGAAFAAYWMLRAYQDNAIYNTDVREVTFDKIESIPTHYIGIIGVLIGLVLVLANMPKVAQARRARNIAFVGYLRSGTGGGGMPTLPSGVTEDEIRALIRRLDVMMAKLPDEDVNEFARTREADTYLKLIGS